MVERIWAAAWLFLASAAPVVFAQAPNPSQQPQLPDGPGKDAGQGYRPKTQKFETWIIPSGGGVVRNMMPTRDGRGLALAESGVNGLALVSIH
jgi:hypothetical protein